MAVATRVRCGDWFDQRTGKSGALGSAKAGRRGFWLVAAVFLVVQLGGTLPIPLYVIWQPRFGFNAGVLTLIFAVYAVGTLLALVLISPLSDQLGRRPTLIAAVFLSAASTGVFLVAGSTGALLAARFLSGLASGLVAPTGTAALQELEPRGSSTRASLTATTSNLGGLGLGALCAGIVAEYGHNPTKLLFWLYLALLVPTLLSIVAVSETVSRPRAIDWRPHGLKIPPNARGQFAIVAGAIFCAYTLNGLYSSLVPSFLAGSLHEHNHAIAGAISAGVFLIAVLSQLGLHGTTPRTALTSGMVLLMLSLGLIELALWDGKLSVFLCGTVAGGLAAGLAFMGGIATVNRIAEPEHRAQAVAAFLASAFAGLTIPAVAVGLSSDSLGTKDATLYCCIVIGTLALIALAFIQRSGGKTKTAPGAITAPNT